MLDSLFELGQLVSLFGLASGFVLTVRYRKCVDDAHPAQPSGTAIDLRALRNSSDALATSLNALDASPEHVERAAA
jgi:hypothetical protein